MNHSVLKTKLKALVLFSHALLLACKAKEIGEFQKFTYTNAIELALRKTVIT